MSFDQMEPEDLFKMATEEFGIELLPSAATEEVKAALVEAGVSWDMAVQFYPTAAQIDAQNKEAALAVADEATGVEPAVKPKAAKKAKAVAEPEVVEQLDLLRMTRENRRYDIRGYTFHYESPFGLVDSDTAAWIVENVDGFRYATPKEAKEFYS